ncbi:MAG: transcription-repair coupling factor [Dehalococcoidia bacterium]|nr:transcription-repair coupling factor [Dehalococcoidia bacterium]
MRLHGLLPVIRETNSYRRLRAQLLEPGALCFQALPEAADSCFLSALSDDLTRTMCVLVADPERAAILAEEMGNWVAPGTSVRRLMEPDFPQAAAEAGASESALARAELASHLALERSSLSQLIVVTSVLGTVGSLPDINTLMSSTIRVRNGTSLPPAQLMEQLQTMGYEHVEQVTRGGEMSKRGGIVDVFSPAHAQPVRLEFFGNAIDTLRYFDPLTQRTLSRIDEASITPVNATAGPSTILNYLPEDTIMVVEDPPALRLRALRLETEMAEYLAAAPISARDSDPAQAGYVAWSDIERQLSARPRLIISSWDESQLDRTPPSFTSPLSYVQRTPALISDIPGILAAGERVVIVTLQARRLSDLFDEAEMTVPISDDVENTPPAASLSLVQGSLRKGWTLPGQIRLLTDMELFGFVKQSRRQSAARPRSRPAALSFRPGDLVTHIDHGIGRFAGLTTLTTGGIEHEYLEITYLDSDTLYVPTEQIQRVARYIGKSESAPHLSRLGSTEWESTKQRVRQSTKALARELIQLYAQRQLAEGYAFSPDTIWQQEIEAAFPYVETPDQVEAISSVKQDMESRRPMDRIICGDVGYGKTEVALRAAFKAVMEGKQVAILAPTTVLAQQHFTTFAERMEAFPVRTQVLSRFTPSEKEVEIIAGLTAGTVDICIGTHRLLQKDIDFKDLGLLIIDEEQRFGVMQKETLRTLRAGLDTLTLSATPIPRTLHMALTGIRDMSTMETPPEERLAVRTHVGPSDSTLIRQAILHEVERNGQGFFVHNRIDSIHAVAAMLQELVPEATFAVAHGRMQEDQLERTMRAFTAGETDFLIATTIIQLGLDMSNANTLIVNHADRLGLTQLYQLRGRVGRGRNQAYAYFFHDRNKELTSQAKSRLRTIYEANELGAGLEIALRDLEIRGAGSLLGTRQSGHIAAVGFELYCQILAEEVENLQPSESVEVSAHRRQSWPALDLPVSAYIPDSYITSPATRIVIYRKLADASTLEDISHVADEMRDRFGAPPAPTNELLYIARIRVRAAAAGITSITRQGSDIVLVPERMDSLPVHLNLGPAVHVGNTQVRINTRRTGGKWRPLLDALLTKR